jgi:hypothetical protein
VVVIAGLAVLAVPAGAARVGLCNPPGGSRVLVKDVEALVVSAPVRRHGRVVARRVLGCSITTGRTMALGRDDRRAHTSVGPIAVAGSRVGYGTSVCRPTCRAQVVTADLATGTRAPALDAIDPSTRALGDTGDAVDTVAVTSTGFVAWIAQAAIFDTSGPRPVSSVLYEVHKRDSAGAVTLDVGPFIDARSLGLAADAASITWTDGGVPRSAPLA